MATIAEEKIENELEKSELTVDKGDEISSITINYKNGETKVIDKGIVSLMKRTLDKNDEEMITLSMECCNISGKEMIDFVYGMMHFYANLIDKKDKE